MFRLKYKIVRTLSHGEHATVCVVRSRFSGREYLAKKTKPPQAALDELDHLHLLKGKPGMPELHDFYVNRSRTWFIFRWYRGGELYDRIHREEYDSIVRCRVLLLALSRAVHEAHACNIAHLNVCPENFVFGRDHQVHLVDFVHARRIYNPWLNSLIGPVGETPFAAPETQATHMPYFTCTSDVYSLGVLYSLLALGRSTPDDQDLQRDMTYENPTQRADLATVIQRLVALLPPPPPSQ